MKFYNKYYANNFEELLTYYPRFYRDVYEMVEILKAQGKLADEIEANIEKTYRNCFIDYADEPTLAKLEQFLGIGLNKNRPFDERRRLIKSYFLGFGKISATKIKEMLGVFTDNTIDIHFLDHVLKIEFNHDINEAMHFHQDIKKLLYQKLPAHILFLIDEKYAGNFKIFVKTKTAITFTTAFYPQFNLPELLLNGNWKLDGSKTLNGYDGSEHIDLYPVKIELQDKVKNILKQKLRVCFLTETRRKIASNQEITIQTEAYPRFNLPKLSSDEYIDLYPVEIEVQAKTAEVLQEKPKIIFSTETREKITNKPEIRFKASAIHHGTTEERITVQTETEVKTGTGEIFMDNQNFLDGSWELDGSRTLNGGDYQW